MTLTTIAALVAKLEHEKALLRCKSWEGCAAHNEDSFDRLFAELHKLPDAPRDDRNLEHSISYAIGLTSLRPFSRIAADNDREKMAAARTIIEHLKVCASTPPPGPAAPLHSTHSGPKSLT
jgi:hypothetical protein